MTWATSAAGGDVVEPPLGLINAGWPVEGVPPAPYFNFIFNTVGSWLEFLRGPNVGHWTRVAWATSPATYGATYTRLACDVDTVTVDGDAACYRFACVGEETTGPTQTLRVSQTGHEWTRRTNVPSGLTGPFALHTDGVRWMLAGTNGGPYEIYSGVVDDGTGTGPMGAGTSWGSASAIDSGTLNGEVKAFASHGGKTFALSSNSGFFSVNHGVNWNVYTLVGTARSGDGLDAVHDGALFVFVTQTGQIYAGTDGATFTYKTTLAITAAGWRLAAGRAGEVVAYRIGSAISVDLKRSTDSGGTFATVTPTGDNVPKNITSLRYQDGTWLATTSVAPWLWSSNDLVSWLALRTPGASGTSSDLFALRYFAGGWVAFGNGFALHSGRAVDPQPGSYVPGSTAGYLADAGYLRGIPVTGDTPADGDVITYDAGTGTLVYAAPSGTSSPLTTNGDLYTRAGGVDARLAVGTDGYVLGVVSGAPTWRSPSQARGDIGAGTGNGDVSASTLTTRGDLFVRGAAAIGRLALGAANAVLASDGTDPVWRTVAAMLAGLSNTRGDVLRRGSGAWEALSLGAARRVLASDGVDLGYSTIAEVLNDISSSTGRMLRRGSGAGAWEAFDAHAADTFVGGDGTDVTTRTAAQVLASLYAPVPISLAVTTGWSTTGTGSSINTGSQQVDVVIPAAAGTFTSGAASHAPPAAYGRWEVVARLRTHSGATNAGDAAQLKITGAGASTNAYVNIRGDGTVVAGTEALTASAVSVASLRGGQGWARMIVDGGDVLAYVGVGSAGARPTTWTFLGKLARSGLFLGLTENVLLGASRGGTISGDLTVAWGDVSCTDLAP